MAIDKDTYILCKDMYLNEKYTITKIGEILKVNRKLLSRMFRDDGIITKRMPNPDLLNSAVKLLNMGKSLTSVASELSIDRHTLSKRLEDVGLRKPQNYPRDKSLDNDIIDYFVNKNMAKNKIAEFLGISTNKVWNCLRAYNISTENRQYKKYHYNESAFINITSPEEAYWFGFLYADGYINKNHTTLEFSLKYTDTYQVEKFTRFLSPDKDIIFKNVNGFFQSKIFINSKKICDNLIKLGCCNAKTFSIKFPYDIVPDNLMRHFIRGYFDGDGCVFMNQYNRPSLSIISASYDFIKDLHIYLCNKLNINYTMLCTNKPRKPWHKYQYSFSHHKKEDIKKLYDYFYTGTNLFLERKYNMLNIINTCYQCRPETKAV